MWASSRWLKRSGGQLNLWRSNIADRTVSRRLTGHVKLIREALIAARQVCGDEVIDIALEQHSAARNRPRHSWHLRVHPRPTRARHHHTQTVRRTIRGLGTK